MDEENRNRPAFGALSESEMIGELIRRAGPRARASHYRLEEFRDEAERRWERVVTKRQRRRRIRRVATATLALAATLAMAVVALRLLGVTGGSSLGTVEVVVDVLEGREAGAATALAVGDSIAPRSLLATGAGRAAIRLTNGIRLRLDQDTEVRLLASDRLRLVEGTVYVDATGAADADYLDVETGLGTARDIGTIFQVKRDDSGVAVQVREGRVAVRRRDERYEADAGQELRLSSDGSVETLAVPLSGPEWEWSLAAAPAFDLEGASLGGYLDWLRRETGWWVQFEGGDPLELRTTRLHGSLEGVLPNRTPELVLPGCGLEYRLENGTLTLLPQDPVAR